MLIKVIDRITDQALHETMWKMYQDAFEELNTLAVQRHLMFRSEFDAVMADTRVDKYLALDDDGTICGVATYTNDLLAVPLIAPQYFEKHWPDHYAAHKIWYIGFVAVSPHAQGREAFAQLVEQMYMVADLVDGGAHVVGRGERVGPVPPRPVTEPVTHASTLLRCVLA